MTKQYGDYSVELVDHYTNDMHKNFMSALTSNMNANTDGSTSMKGSSTDAIYEIALSMVKSVTKDGQEVDKNEIMNWSFSQTKDLWIDIVDLAKEDDTIYNAMKATLVGVSAEKKV